MAQNPRAGSIFPEIFENEPKQISGMPHTFNNCTFSISRPSTVTSSDVGTILPTVKSSTVLAPTLPVKSLPICTPESSTLKPAYDPKIHDLKAVEPTALHTDKYNFDEYDDFFETNIFNIPDFDSSGTNLTRAKPTSSVNNASVQNPNKAPARKTDVSAFHSLASPVPPSRVILPTNLTSVRPGNMVWNPYTSTSAKTHKQHGPTQVQPKIEPESKTFPTTHTSSRERNTNSSVWLSKDTVVIRGEVFKRTSTPRPMKSEGSASYAPGFYPGNQRK